MVTNNAINTGKPIEVSNGGTSSASFTTYGPVVAASTSTGALTSVSPSATSGVPLISQGASANPAFGTMVVAGGGTGIATTTAYGLITGGTTATGAFQNTGTGTSGQMLKSAGSAALPTWVNPSTAGSLVFLQSQTASASSSINFTSQISASYTTYLLTYSNVLVSVSLNNVKMQISNNNGSTYLTTGYTAGDTENQETLTTWSNTNSDVYGTDYFQVTGGMLNPSVGATGSFWMYNVGNGNQFLCFSQHMSIFTTTGNFLFTAFSQGINTSTTANAFKLYASPAGNISTGTFTLYGLVQ